MSKKKERKKDREKRIFKEYKIRSRQLDIKKLEKMTTNEVDQEFMKILDNSRLKHDKLNTRFNFLDYLF